MGQRVERNFTEHEEQEAMASSLEIAKELERANVYDRILQEIDGEEAQSLDLNLNKHDLIQYLKEKQKKRWKKKEVGLILKY